LSGSGRPILYSFRRCPFAMRARLALSVAGIECELREVVLRDKPPQLIEISPKATVPVLQLSDGTVIDESLDVMRWALARNDPFDWLVPPNGNIEEMYSLICNADGDFKEHLDRYKYAERYDGANALEHRGKGEMFLQSLERKLQNAPQLYGSRPCIADYAILPFIRQFANADLEWFFATPYLRVQAWLTEHLNSALFQSIMSKYAQWHYGDEAVVTRPYL